ncbi:MAG: hypothetical protein JNL01_13860 [Bdellovibrionales bacterium]|nr:hypothetical protein [Bdellovibrionales bacterium]
MLTVLALSLVFPAQSFAKTYPTGLIRTPQTKAALKSVPTKEFTDADGLVPGKATLRGLTGAVEDQGNCGSCWDFALTATLRGSLMTAGKDPGRLSYNYLLNCATDQLGCQGGYFDAAAWLLTPKGAPIYGADGVYRARQSKCQAKPVAGSAVEYRMLGPGGTTPSFRDIAYVVGVLKRPVAVVVAADDSWQQQYWGGKKPWSGCTDQTEDGINHMVMIEGYDCESSVDSNGNCVFDQAGNLPPTVGTWVIRNSWGTAWGDKGYMWSKATNKKGERCNMIGYDAAYFDF